jgi:hypothetical protein
VPEQQQIKRLKRTTWWLAGTLTVLVLVLLLWRWLYQSTLLWGLRWRGALALLLVGAVLLAAVRVLIGGFDSLQELERQAIRVHRQANRRVTLPGFYRRVTRQLRYRGLLAMLSSLPPRPLLRRLDDETKGLPDISASTFREFTKQHRDLLRTVKAHVEHEDLEEAKSLLARERRYALAGDRLLAVGNLWLVRWHFRQFVAWLGVAGLLAALLMLTVAPVARARSTSPRGPSPAERGSAITSPTPVLVFAYNRSRHQQLFGLDCPPVGVRGMAIAGSLATPLVVTYGTPQSMRTRSSLTTM